eukprot:8447633-Karenia_brevis.AAC.1
MIQQQMLGEVMLTPKKGPGLATLSPSDGAQRRLDADFAAASFSGMHGTQPAFDLPTSPHVALANTDPYMDSRDHGGTKRSASVGDSPQIRAGMQRSSYGPVVGERLTRRLRGKQSVSCSSEGSVMISRSTEKDGK